jgi:hypothetical protein
MMSKSQLEKPEYFFFCIVSCQRLPSESLEMFNRLISPSAPGNKPLRLFRGLVAPASYFSR